MNEDLQSLSDAKIDLFLHMMCFIYRTFTIKLLEKLSLGKQPMKRSLFFSMSQQDLDEKTK